jgi:hypothetical protein
VGQGVLHGQDAAPRLAVEDEVVGTQPQRGPHLLDLVDEAGNLPQRRLVGLVGVVGPQLVVEDDAVTRRDERLLEVEQVLVGGPRTAVEHQHGQPAGVPRRAGPDLEVSGRGGHRDPAYAVLVGSGAHAPTLPRRKGPPQ